MWAKTTYSAPEVELCFWLSHRWTQSLRSCRLRFVSGSVCARRPSSPPECRNWTSSAPRSGSTRWSWRLEPRPRTQSELPQEPWPPHPPAPWPLTEAGLGQYTTHRVHFHSKCAGKQHTVKCTSLTVKKKGRRLQSDQNILTDRNFIGCIIQKKTGCILHQTFISAKVSNLFIFSTKIRL